MQNISHCIGSDSDPYFLFLYRTRIRVRVRLQQCKWAITDAAAWCRVLSIWILFWCSGWEAEEVPGSDAAVQFVADGLGGYQSLPLHGNRRATRQGGRCAEVYHQNKGTGKIDTTHLPVHRQLLKESISVGCVPPACTDGTFFSSHQMSALVVGGALKWTSWTDLQYWTRCY